jgi:hypothetical protein
MKDYNSKPVGWETRRPEGQEAKNINWTQIPTDQKKFKSKMFE